MNEVHNSLIVHCEQLALELGRVGAFADMSYRLFPHTRNSFTPNLIELGFNFEEMRQVTNNTELRFQIFPSTFVTPIKKELEELRAVLRNLDRGPFSHMGTAFLTHEDLTHYRSIVSSKREMIRSALRNEMIENYDKLRKRAFTSLKATFETLLPRIGVSNSREVLSSRSWFDHIFPAKNTLTGDFRLNVLIHNVHPNTLLDSEILRREIERFLLQPEQLTIFGLLEQLEKA